MVREEFNLRVEEIERYYTFLQNIEQFDYTQGSQLIDENLAKILKANGFLLLYNLIESSVYHSIIEIFEELKNKKITYQSITPQLKKFWLKTKFKNEEAQTHQSISQKSFVYIEEIINNFPIDLLIKTIDYGGTITPNKIRQLSNELGLSFKEFSYKDYPNGKALTNIKAKRNELAHGKYSFGQIGRNLSFSGQTKEVNGEIKIIEFGLIHFKEFTITHLSEFINSVEDYIKGKKYAN
ncbi:MAG: MAE_28990/MAE_18760 family HEPN-like nuclease [Flavobacterium sp.]|nr:MAE_28990/MAE_18760 family HEPN-like nuclease [Flavobacterium sp.]